MLITLTCMVVFTSNLEFKYMFTLPMAWNNLFVKFPFQKNFPGEGNFDIFYHTE